MNNIELGTLQGVTEILNDFPIPNDIKSMIVAHVEDELQSNGFLSMETFERIGKTLKKYEVAVYEPIKNQFENKHNFKPLTLEESRTLTKRFLQLYERQLQLSSAYIKILDDNQERLENQIKREQYVREYKDLTTQIKQTKKLQEIVQNQLDKEESKWFFKNKDFIYECEEMIEVYDEQLLELRKKQNATKAKAEKVGKTALKKVDKEQITKFLSK